MSRRKQQPVPPSPARLSRLAQQRKRQRLTLLGGLLAVFLVLATLGIGYFYTGILPRWETAATVNGSPISASYYAKLLRLVAGPTTRDPALLASLALQQAIENELILQRASTLGLAVTPQEIEDYPEVPAGTSPGVNPDLFEERFRSYIHQVGFSAEELRRVAEARLLRQKALDHFMQQVPGEAEQVDLYLCLVADEGQAQALLDRLGAGEGFTAVAEEVCPDTPYTDGKGKVGWLPRGVLHSPVLEETAFTLEPGTLSQPLAVAPGYYILKVEDREVRELEAAYRQQMGIIAWQQWLDEQAQSSQIEEVLSPRLIRWVASHARW